MKYIKKPIPIEAVQLTRGMVEAHLFDQVPLPAGVRMGSANFNSGRRQIHSVVLYCLTLENDSLRVEPGCWILGPGAGGEYWPVQDDIFRATYEPAA